MWAGNQPIVPFGPSHTGALAVTAAGLAVWILLVRKKPPAARVVELAAAAVLLSLYPVGWCLAASQNNLTLDSFAPLHLCDWAAIAGGFALLTHRPLLVELTYFWGLAGTLNGLITPNLQFDYPHPHYFRFFALHSGVVAAALYLTIGRRFWPRPGAVWQGIVATEVFVVVAGLTDWISGSNFGFLHHLPENPSLLDHLGPHPQYVLWLQPIGAAFFVILYAPFWLARRRARGRST